MTVLMLTEDLGMRVMTPEELDSLKDKTQAEIALVVRVLTGLRDLRMKLSTQH